MRFFNGTKTNIAQKTAKKAAKKNNYWFNYMYNNVYWNKPFKEIKDYEEKLAKITPKFIKKTANKYVGKPELTAKLLPE